MNGEDIWRLLIALWAIGSVFALLGAGVTFEDANYQVTRRRSALLMLTCWAWPLWLVGAFVWGVVHLGRVVLGKEF